MGNFEIWLRDTLAQAEKFLAEAEGERDASPEKYSEWNYWRGRANALNEAVNTFISPIPVAEAVTKCLDKRDGMSYNGDMDIDVVDLMMAFRKQDLLAMAAALSVDNEVHSREPKAKIASDLSEVLCVTDVLDWATSVGFKVSVK